MRQELENSWQQRNRLSYSLWPLSQLYKAVMWLRTKAYQLGLIKSESLSLPTIVIGNISVGGTGKTPLVIELVNWLQQQGYKPAVIMRGYAGKHRVAAYQVTSQTDVAYCGDEASLIFARTGANVVICRHRVEAGRFAIEKTDCDVIICDDGFQHLRLKRDFNVIVIDANRGFGNGWCLPAGFLREPIGVIGRAQAVVFNGQPTDELISKIPATPLYTMQFTLSQAYNLATKETCSLEVFVNKQVNAVAAIGHPERFFSGLRHLGIHVQAHAFADHHVFSQNDLLLNNPSCILMTEKDAVKCQAMDESLRQKIWVVPVQVEIENTLFQRIRQTIEDKK